MLHIVTTPRFKAEKQYVFQVLLGELLGITFRVSYEEGVQHYRLQVPNGRTVIIEDHFWGRQSGDDYLDKKNIPAETKLAPHPFKDGEDIVCVFGKPSFSIDRQNITCGIDLFASAFFMLARWEEYVLPDRDVHGRFPADQSLAWRAGFLDRPVVNEWAALLQQMLIRLGWNPAQKNDTFRFHLSCDVDHPRLWWSAADRLRTVGGSIFRRGNWREASFWIKNHFFDPKDPYDVFDEWFDWMEKNGHTGHFNFLGERPPASNCWYPLRHPFVKNLIEKINKRGHTIGFHPSCEAFEDQEVFMSELASLRSLSPAPVTSGRQHYLRFAAPFTWQAWEEAGMAWDSTAGYSDAEGFRCGICREFPVFNFLTQKTLRLREKPLIAMDVTLAHYRQYSPEQACNRLQYLKKQVQKHNGEFVLLWHNSSWNSYFWAPWREVYQVLTAQ
ncbi:MAG: polysaccharide deacetylase family protein [Lewinellaceae bacterium]|nr:polysaccharide deacetylase family protein [Lewinellaceae bacterium]